MKPKKVFYFSKNNVLQSIHLIFSNLMTSMSISSNISLSQIPTNKSRSISSIMENDRHIINGIRTVQRNIPIHNINIILINTNQSTESKRQVTRFIIVVGLAVFSKGGSQTVWVEVTTGGSGSASERVVIFVDLANVDVVFTRVTDFVVVFGFYSVVVKVVVSGDKGVVLGHPQVERFFVGVHVNLLGSLLPVLVSQIMAVTIDLNRSNLLVFRSKTPPFLVRSLVPLPLSKKSLATVARSIQSKVNSSNVRLMPSIILLVPRSEKGNTIILSSRQSVFSQSSTDFVTIICKTDRVEFVIK